MQKLMKALWIASALSIVAGMFTGAKDMSNGTDAGSTSDRHGDPVPTSSPD